MTNTEIIDLLNKVSNEGFDYYFSMYASPNVTTPFYKEHLDYQLAESNLRAALADLYEKLSDEEKDLVDDGEYEFG